MRKKILLEDLQLPFRTLPCGCLAFLGDTQIMRRYGRSEFVLRRTIKVEMTDIANFRSRKTWRTGMATCGVNGVYEYGSWLRNYAAINLDEECIRRGRAGRFVKYILGTTASRTQRIPPFSTCGSLIIFCSLYLYKQQAM